MPTEHAEHVATTLAWSEVDAWMRPGTNEGITFGITRLAGALAASASFVGGGDLSLYTAGSPRGSLRSQGSSVDAIDAGLVHSAPIDVAVSLRTGVVEATWNDPVSASAMTAKLTLELDQAIGPVGGRAYLFHGESVHDDASWTLAMTLL